MTCGVRVVRPEDLVLFVIGLSSTICSIASRLRFGDTVSIGRLANSKICGLAVVKASTSSSIAQLDLNFSSWSVALQAGHRPSLFRHLRMHIEQNVCEQEVIIGVLKNSLHTWHRSAESTEESFGRDVVSQSVESVISSSLDDFEVILRHMGKSAYELANL
jgi:hypothetical protein